MYRLFSVNGDLIGQWENRSELVTALEASYPGWEDGSVDGPDENNFPIYDERGTTIANVTGPLVVDDHEKREPEPPK